MIEQFESYLRVTRSLPSRQVRNYFHYPLLSILPDFFKEEGIATVQDLAPDVVNRLVLSLEERKKRDGSPISSATRVAYLKAIRQFLGWAGGEGLAPTDGKQIGIPSLKKKRKNLVSREEQRRLLDGAKIERDKLIIQLMLETAAREEGVANIRTTDLIERDGRFFFVRISDKTGSRLSPISRELYRRLSDYRSGRTGRPRTKSGYLFMYNRRSRITKEYEPLDTDGIYRAIKAAAEDAGFEPQRIHPHLLRATAITKMCNAGMHPATVSEITGVSVAVIARNYNNPTPEEMWE
ncbi:MAG: tyrosine-type recombinase/integrase, partial [Candidatus Dormibacteraceae bacterium]